MARNSAPTIIAWSSKQEIADLKSWFYDPQPTTYPGDESIDLRQRAIQRVQAYQTRATLLPSEVVSTALLTQSLLLLSTPNSPSLVFRTSMTLALIRFVNSLLDPLQKRDKSLPLSVLAVTAGLPTVFVEVRHRGTHESNLPGTEVLRDMGIRALEWLYHNYWNKVQNTVDLRHLSMADETQKAELLSVFQKRRDEDYEKLMIELCRYESFEASSAVWDPLISFLLKELSTFNDDMIEYMLNYMIATPSYKLPIEVSNSTVRYNNTLFSWAVNLMTWNTPWNAHKLKDNVEVRLGNVAAKCAQYPNTLAWVFLRDMLTPANPGKPTPLPEHVVKWLEDEIRQGNKTTAPSSIEEIENEIEQLKRQTMVANDDPNQIAEISINGWKKYQGNWTPQPMGTYI